MNPKLFENFKFGNWYAYVSKAKAMPLKMIIENVQFTVESIATAIDAQKVDDQLFKLPAGATLEKSPF